MGVRTRGRMSAEAAQRERRRQHESEEHIDRRAALIFTAECRQSGALFAGGYGFLLLSARAPYRARARQELIREGLL